MVSWPRARRQRSTLRRRPSSRRSLNITLTLPPPVNCDELQQGTKSSRNDLAEHADVREMINAYHAGHLLRRLVILWVMALLVALFTTMVVYRIGSFASHQHRVRAPILAAFVILGGLVLTSALLLAYDLTAGTKLSMGMRCRVIFEPLGSAASHASPLVRPNHGDGGSLGRNGNAALSSG
ncbi:hypothetical protein RJ55_02039 [Drechmeria coniospora]|nr:hypothetical protein RJ55_02039 [Drechmeria coniospora]